MASTAETVAGAAGEATEKGMPQLNFATWPNQIFWLLVALVVLYVVLTRIVLPRIASVLAERKGTIGNDLAAAEELKGRAKAAEKAYNLALEQARAEANKIIAVTKAEIKADLDAAMAKADAEIGTKAAESEQRIAGIRAGAMDAVAEVARDTAGALIVALGGHADAATIDAAVAARLKG
jgi:F-type H+-transporting ATPase subunit b